ncbi:unnamed protein product [Amoebophrya sp. A25]|nr:unnamed protein product [Amoebophrya sp. A25]|eukprot:GSA25T00015399001.1
MKLIYSFSCSLSKALVLSELCGLSSVEGVKVRGGEMSNQTPKVTAKNGASGVKRGISDGPGQSRKCQKATVLSHEAVQFHEEVQILMEKLEWQGLLENQESADPLGPTVAKYDEFQSRVESIKKQVEDALGAEKALEFHQELERREAAL